MEQLLAQCSAFLPANMPLLLSAALAGLVGSISHCSLMCSPLVMAQMLSLHEQQKPQRLMAWYHAGRISTYMLLGVLAFAAASVVFGGKLASIASVMMVAAGSIFIFSAVQPRKTHRCCDSKTHAMSQRIAQLANAPLQLYLRGALMGFMPCGLLVSMWLLAGASGGALYAALLMLAFGLGTLPVLQAAGFGALSLGRRYPSLGAKLGRASMAINGAALCAIGFNIVKLY